MWGVGRFACFWHPYPVSSTTSHPCGATKVPQRTAFFSNFFCSPKKNLLMQPTVLTIFVTPSSVCQSLMHNIRTKKNCLKYPKDPRLRSENVYNWRQNHRRAEHLNTFAIKRPTEKELLLIIGKELKIIILFLNILIEIFLRSKNYNQKFSFLGQLFGLRRTLDLQVLPGT